MKRLIPILAAGLMAVSCGIYSFTGTMLKKGVLSEGTTQVTLPSVNGIYFIRTTYGEQSQTHKIVIY